MGKWQSSTPVIINYPPTNSLSSVPWSEVGAVGAFYWTVWAPDVINPDRGLPGLAKFCEASAISWPLNGWGFWSVIDAALEVYTAFGVMLVTYHFRVHASQIEVGGAVFAAAGEDHLGFGGLAQQGLHDWFYGKQF